MRNLTGRSRNLAWMAAGAGLAATAFSVTLLAPLARPDNRMLAIRLNTFAGKEGLQELIAATGRCTSRFRVLSGTDGLLAVTVPVRSTDADTYVCLIDSTHGLPITLRITSANNLMP